MNSPSMINDATKWNCQDCGKGFTKSQYLKRHMRNIHYGAKIPCSFCSNNASFKSNLNKHIEAVHASSIMDGEFMAAKLLFWIQCSFVTQSRLYQNENNERYCHEHML